MDGRDEAIGSMHAMQPECIAAFQHGTSKNDKCRAPRGSGGYSPQKRIERGGKMLSKSIEEVKRGQNRSTRERARVEQK
jgi:hypothetical protein